jgi:hypothetical protein
VYSAEVDNHSEHRRRRSKANIQRDTPEKAAINDIVCAFCIMFQRHKQALVAGSSGSGEEMMTRLPHQHMACDE